MISSYRPVHHPLHITLLNIADAMEELLWSYTLSLGEQPTSFCRFDVYTPGEQLEKDVLYMLPDDRAAFPVDEFPYVCAGSRAGKADHICVRGKEKLVVIKILAQVFQRFRGLEADVNWLLSNRGSLEELCKIGSAFLQNPVYIHDKMFTVLAQSGRVEGMLKVDYNPQTGNYFIPLWLIEDFKFNKGYSETLRQRHAAIWGTDQYPYTMRSLYVNIWDEDFYRGRLLINELHEPLKPGDNRTAEYLAECALTILRREEWIGHRKHQDHEDIMRGILAGEAVDPVELHLFFTAHGWKEEDSFVLLCLQSQVPDREISSYHVLRSTLSSGFPEAFVMLYEHRLCMVVDVDCRKAEYGSFRSRLAPILRDSLMYGGMSLPVQPIGSLPAALEQAQHALRQVWSVQDYRWLMGFDECALGYLLTRLRLPAHTRDYLSPALRELRSYDLEHGTQYWETLRQYLRNDRSIPKTAAVMSIHRTTLLYRLEKLQTITRIDFEQEQARMYLILSFLLWEQESGG